MHIVSHISRIATVAARSGMSAFAVSVEGVIDCQTAQQQEHHSFTYNTTHLTPAALSSIASASPSPSSISDASASPASSSPTPPPSAETAALHELVSLIHLAQKDGNAFLTSMLNKYPKRQSRPIHSTSPLPLLRLLQLTVAINFCCADRSGSPGQAERQASCRGRRRRRRRGHRSLHHCGGSISTVA